MFLLWIKILQKFWVNKINKELTKGLKKVQLEKKLELKRACSLNIRWEWKGYIYDYLAYYVISMKSSKRFCEVKQEKLQKTVEGMNEWKLN